MDSEEGKRLAKEHREWLEGLLMRELRSKMDLYEETIEHGFKHGVDYERTRTK